MRGSTSSGDALVRLRLFMPACKRVLTFWRGTPVGGDVYLLVLAGLTAFACVRVVRAFELDALATALLTGLLFWVQLYQRRRLRGLVAKIDHLIICRAYGPLSDEDHEVIRALRMAARRPARMDPGEG